MSHEQLKDTVAIPVAKPPSRVSVQWVGEKKFEGRRTDGSAPILMDAGGRSSPGPVDTLLIALAGCTGVDVVDILAKRRTPVSALSVDVEGQRKPGVPARVTAIHLTFRIIGAEVERTHAERAIELAVTKYCSVRDSLDPNMPITWGLELNGG
jgi:putative redox protein